MPFTAERSRTEHRGACPARQHSHSTGCWNLHSTEIHTKATWAARAGRGEAETDTAQCQARQPPGAVSDSDWEYRHLTETVLPCGLSLQNSTASNPSNPIQPEQIQGMKNITEEIA